MRPDVWQIGMDIPQVRCRANTAHTRQSRPESGLAFQVKVSKILQVVPSSLGGGLAINHIRVSSAEKTDDGFIKMEAATFGGVSPKPSALFFFITPEPRVK